MKILFISSEIWSEKNPEGIVARKIVHGLIENKCIVDLITLQKTNIKEINQEYVVRINSNELISKLKKKIIGIEKKKFVDSVKKNIDIYTANNYDVIITRSEPFYIHETGYFFKLKINNIKWIASFGDPVFLNPYNSNLFLKRYFAKKLEKKYWKYADIVTHTNNAAINEYVKNGFDKKKAIVLENPFVFTNLNNSNKLHTVNNNVIRLAYIGSFYGKRNIKPILKFLSINKISFQLIIIGGVRNSYYENRFGKLTKYLFNRDIKKIMTPVFDFNYQDKVKLLPFMNKTELDQYIMENIDVLINIDAYTGNKNIFLSSKIVEYLQYQKPILNFSVEGATVDFLKSVGIDFYVNLKEPECVKVTREILLNLIPNKNIEYFTSLQVCKRLVNSILMLK
jgi:glycosyltransferase involved in cell wall biosynthesis